MGRRLSAFIALVAALVAIGAGQAAAATYYVSASGSDSNAGTSPSSAWRTVNKVNGGHFAPGDSVLFEGGSTFSDSTLMPAQSGTAGSPIVFGSYGSGQATISNTQGAVWFAGKSYLTFDNLDLTSGGSATGVFAGSGSAGSDHIVLRNSVVENSGGVGVIAPNAGDSAWTISHNTFRNLGDSGLIIFASNTMISGNTITHVGVNAAITYGKHGIYAKGPDMTIANNDISDVTGGQAVSIRFHGARVYGNTIHDTGYGFAFFDYDPAPAPQGTSYIYDNRLWNISGWGFYYDNFADPNGNAPTVDFVVASNTFSFNGASEAINVSPSGTAHVTIANNIFTGTYASALRSAPTTVENHNDWYGAGSNVPHNAGDVTTAPNLAAAPGFALPGGSPLVDAGASLGSLAYTSSCDGSALSFCGGAPDLGAVESVPVPVIVQPLAPPSNLNASDITTTALTLQWTASPDSRAIGYRVTQNGNVVATPTAANAAISSLACGTTYTFAVVAVDVTGATSSAATASVAALACPVRPPPAPAPDTTPPAVAFTSPTANAAVPLSFAIGAAASDASGVARVTFSVDGRVTCTTTAAPYACAAAVTKQGWHTLTVQAVDGAGNTASATISVYATKRLRQLAQVVAAAPASGTSVASTFVVHARAVVSRGKPVVFRLDGHARCIDRAAPYTCTLRALRGWHVVAVRAGSTRALNLQLHVG